ncbi:MAG TPA: hypothetical protein VLE99_04180 [Candidatus Saccharimonadales bacterium]|nr:hypothetical protein [Candidatus Saccharimonadales bacterium]
MGLLDDIVKLINNTEAGLDKAIESMEQVAEKPGKLLDGVTAKDVHISRSVDKLSNSD